MIKTDSGLYEVHLSDGTVETEVNHVLQCVGRRANTDGIGLPEAGIELNSRGGVKVDEFENTTAEKVYAIGDVTDKI